MKQNRLFIVTVIDAATSEVLASSEEPVEHRFLVAEGRDIAQRAWHVVLAREKQRLGISEEEKRSKRRATSGS